MQLTLKHKQFWLGLYWVFKDTIVNTRRLILYYISSIIHKKTMNWHLLFFGNVFALVYTMNLYLINSLGNNWKYWNFRTHSTRTDKRRQSLPRKLIDKSLQTFCRAAILSKTWRPQGIRLLIGELWRSRSDPRFES